MIELGDVKGVECPVRVVERVVVAGDTGGKPALRAFPTMVDLGDGELLVSYDLSRDHQATPPMGLMMTRSFDEGRTWGESFAACALPGYQITGNLGFMKCPDGSIMSVMARCYYPAWRQYQTVSLSEPHVVPSMKPFDEVGPRRFDVFVVRSWDKGYNWTPLDHPMELFPGRAWQTHATGDSGPHELSDGRWMWSVQGVVTDRPPSPSGPALVTGYGGDRWVAGVTYSSDQGFTWSPVKLIHDLAYASATEQRIMRLDERRFLSYTRCDPRVYRAQWKYDDNVVHFSLSEDEGETWSEPWKGNFLGSGSPELHRLNDGSFIIMYRDMDPERVGVSMSHSADEGRTWSFVGHLAGPSDLLPEAHMEGGGSPLSETFQIASRTRRRVELGYPVSLRVSNGQIFVVYYGPWRKENANVVGVYLEDLT